MATKKKSIGVIIGAIIGLLAVTAAAIGIATAVRQNTCKHVWNDGEVKVEATCAKEGKLVFKCEECGKYETEAIEKLAHTWEYVEAELPTCTEDGHTEYTACELCGEYKNGVEPQILLAEGHTEIELEGKAPTCTESGLTAGKYCTTCETITVEQRSLKAKGHTLVTLEAVAPTCTEAGLTAGQKCATCDTVYVEQKEVPALGHTDANKDSKCDVCASSINPTANMVETELFAGDPITEGWYRIYHSENNYVLLEDKIGDFMFTYKEDGAPLHSPMLISEVDENFIYIQSAEKTDEGKPLYIDFYVPNGEFAKDSDGSNLGITADTAISGIDQQGTFFRLEAQQ